MEVTDAETTTARRFRWRFRVCHTIRDRDGTTKVTHPFLNNENTQDLLFLRILRRSPPFAAKRAGKKLTRAWDDIMESVRSCNNATTTTTDDERHSIALMSLDAAKNRYNSYLSLGTSFCQQSEPRTGDRKLDSLIEQLPADDSENATSETELPVALQIYKSLQKLLDSYHKFSDGGEEQVQDKELEMLDNVQQQQPAAAANREVLELRTTDKTAARGNKRISTPAVAARRATDSVIELEDPPLSIICATSDPSPKRRKRSGGSSPTSELTMPNDSYVPSQAEIVKLQEENKKLRNKRRMVQLENERARRAGELELKKLEMELAAKQKQLETEIAAKQKEDEREFQKSTMNFMATMAQLMQSMTSQIQSSQRTQKDQQHQEGSEK